MKHTKQAKPFSLPARLIAMYLLVVGVVCLSYLPMSGSVRERLTANYRRQTNDSFMRSMERFNDSLLQLYGVSDVMSAYPYYYECRAAKVSEVTREYLPKLYMTGRLLTPYLENISVVDKAFVLFSNSRAVVDNRQVYLSLQEFLGYGLEIADYPGEELGQMFDSGVRHLQIASAKVNSNSIGKALLLFVDRKYTGVRVGAVYSERTLRDLYGMELLPEGSGLTVESQTGGTLYQSGGRGKGYAAFAGECPLLNLKVTLSVPEAYYAGMLSSFDSLFLRTLIAAALSGLLLSVLFTFRSWKPVKQLLALSGQGGVRGDEYLHIAQHIRRAGERIETLNTDLSRTHGELCSSLFSRLLSGTVYTEEARTLCWRLFAQLQGPCRVALLKLTAADGAQAEGEMLSFRFLSCLEKARENWGAYYQQVTLDQLSMLLPEREDACSALEELLSPSQTLLDAAGYRLSGGMSDAFTGLDGVHTAWHRAQLALAGAREDQLIACFEHDQPAQDRRTLNFTSLQQIYELMMAGQEAAVEDLLGEVQDGLLRSADDKQPVLQCCALVRFAFEEVVRDMRLTGLPKELTRVSETVGVGELFDSLRQDARMIAQRLCEVRRRAGSDRSRQVMDYIAAHYTEPALCAERIGDEVGLSANSVYQIVRESAGCSLGEYVEGMRLARACELLRTTACSVMAISDACGFGAAATFYRVFKQKYGVTPSQWRKQHVKDENSAQ